MAAAVGLLALTVVVAIRMAQGPALWELAILTAAWTTVLVASLALRRRSMASASPAAAPAADLQIPEAAEVQVDEDLAASAELLQFARELHANVQGERLRTVVASRLPELVGLRDVWVVARFGGRRYVITPADAPGPRRRPLLGGESRDWATFPLTVDGEVVGVLGVGLPPRRFSDRDRRLLTAVASIVARALKTSHLFEGMREASIIDTLTGCVRRPEGLRRLDAELRRAQRTSRSVAVLMLDLDHFKSVNDRFGHNCGDAVLSAVGAIMMRTLRASDLRCRWGGEEFLVALPEASIGAATRVAESLRVRIADLRIRCKGTAVPMTASIGIALARAGEVNIQRLVARADAALYQAKDAGRNCVKVVLSDLRGAPIGGAPEERPPGPTDPAAHEPTATP